MTAQLKADLMQLLALLDCIDIWKTEIADASNPELQQSYSNSLRAAEDYLYKTRQRIKKRMNPLGEK